MHDCLEGVSHVVLCAVIKEIYFVENLLTPDALNSKLAIFHFGFTVPAITRQRILKGHFPLTASQMLHFLLGFPLLFGNSVPRKPLPAHATAS